MLKISVCRFYGPLDNSIGNLCIAGHNYNNKVFFSKLYLLELGDIVTINFNNNISYNYKIYKKYETGVSDISCTSQETNGKKEITLVTCNNITGNRMILKASKI